MDTKQRILDEALTLFSEKGYANVFVGDIAERVGIKAPSLYKHYKSKKAIFDAIIDKMNESFAEQAKAMQINGSDAVADAEIYKGLPEEQLLKLGRQFFLYFLHDDYNQKFSQGMLFGFMVTSGILKTDNVQIMTLHFYAPIYYLLTICDREPDREPEALKLLDDHIKQFDRIYGREN